MQIYQYLLFFHIVSVSIWIGGMAVMHFAIRPTAIEQLEPPQRLAFMAMALGRFFCWVAGAILVLLVSGAALIYSMLDEQGLPHYVHAMTALGLVMMAIFGHIRFCAYSRLRRAVVAKDWAVGAKQLTTIRRLVVVNLALGIITIAVATVGRTLL